MIISRKNRVRGLNQNLRIHNDFRQKFKKQIHWLYAGGDTDSIACITGAFCGALYGSESLPARWIEGLENRGLIEETAGKMCDLRLHSSSV